MQEKLNNELRSFDWEVFFFEDGGWSSLEAFDDEKEARDFYESVINRSGLPQDFYAIIGPQDKVMPLAPASYGQQLQ